jgi:hypothetical protein
LTAPGASNGREVVAARLWTDQARCGWMGAMTCRPLGLGSIAALALIACTPTTYGLGDSGSAAEFETAETETDDDAEGSEADAGTDAPGDGDPSSDDANTDSDESPTGDESSTSCGDGVLDLGEECDGSDLDGLDCEALGFLSGQLSCSVGCSLDTSGCLDATCGDGMIDDREECDGADLGGVDCVALGFGAGKPGCTNDCKLDASVCPTAGEGNSCSLINWCPNNLNCVDNTCYDGSLGDPCKWNSQCQGGLSCKPWGDGTCQP